MSLILTQINRFGIIFASDTNITVNGVSTKKGEKIFDIPHLQAALCLAGTYSIEGISVDRWITSYTKLDKSKNLREFAKNLCNSLEAKMRTEERSAGCIIHIAGFVDKKRTEHPEMWGISNVNLLSNGEYSIKEKFDFREDFWCRDWQNKNIKDLFNKPDGYGYQYYINGFTAGRVSFNVLSLYLNDFLLKLWQDKNYKFRPPKNLDEYNDLATFTMEFISLMFNLSDYFPKYIGGEIKLKTIKGRNNKWFTQ